MLQSVAIQKKKNQILVYCNISKIAYLIGFYGLLCFAPYRISMHFFTEAFSIHKHAAARKLSLLLEN